MQTKHFKLDPNNIDQEIIKQASSIIMQGGLVATPTETVYGLCANALDKEAVSSIYTAKGRPSDNPLIIHIATKEQLLQLTNNVPPIAYKLMDAFWPGPLTIILPKSDIVPYDTTGGLETVAIRMPNNNIMLELIKNSTPLSAPSANISGRPSPTKYSHVVYDLDGKIDAIIDGGACTYGIESTIIDVTTDTPCLLRPGSITVSMLQSVIGDFDIDSTITANTVLQETPKAPGMKYKHYSPSASVTVINGTQFELPNYINSLAKQLNDNNKKVGVLSTSENVHLYDTSICDVYDLGTIQDLNTISSNLFAGLRYMDYLNKDEILAEGITTNDEGLAIMNRLVKSSGYNIITID